MRTTRTRTLLVALLAALALVAGACGDDDDTSAELGGSADADAGNGGADVDADVNAGVDASEFFGGSCQAALAGFAAITSEFVQASAGAFGGEIPDGAATQDELQALADAAPDEIQGAFQVIAEAYGAYFSAIAEVDIEPGEIPTEDQTEQLQAAAEAIDEEALETAQEDIAQWFEDNCGT